MDFSRGLGEHGLLGSTSVANGELTDGWQGCDPG